MNSALASACVRVLIAGAFVVFASMSLSYAIVIRLSTSYSSQMDELENLITEYGTIQKFADHIGLSRQAILKWRKTGIIPENAVWRLQVKTAGRFNAEAYLASRQC